MGIRVLWVPLTTGKNKILLLKPKVIFATAEATKLLNSELIKLFSVLWRDSQILSIWGKGKEGEGIKTIWSLFAELFLVCVFY